MARSSDDGYDSGAETDCQAHQYIIFPSIITLDNNNAPRHHNIMIKSFKGKSAEKVFARDRAKGISPNIQRVSHRKLLILDAVEILEDLRVPPGNHLEKLSGDRKGQHSIRINDQWRICFRWHDGDAYDVEIADYH